jgi:DNA-binding transcriptional LysR family regulator
MNDLAIDYFLIVAKNKSFSKTARELYISQPAISRQISALERELGFTLFDRTNKQTTLTEIGELYYGFFTEYKAGLERTMKKACEINAHQSGSVTVGCLSGWDLSGFIPKIISGFSAHYPNITLTIENYNFSGLVSALNQGDLDCIISIENSLASLRDVNIQPLAKVPRVLLYSSRHSLAGSASVTPADFRNETFLVPQEKGEGGAQEVVRTSMAGYGFVPKMKTVPNIESMLSGVQNGLGVAVSDYWSRERSNDAFRYLMLDTEHMIGLAWSKSNKNSAIPAFVNEITMLFTDGEGLKK